MTLLQRHQNVRASAGKVIHGQQQSVLGRQEQQLASIIKEKRNYTISLPAGLHGPEPLRAQPKVEAELSGLFFKSPTAETKVVTFPGE
ncbi:hypothetical protein NC653_028796 [Populus alba x Populus x berolinensis]|uniref:Uncharacterized protein n=1 Tax=Populus alba x Populus x berolinensis TaxID=444605 RepID=A0AAD6M0I3_9ROSI|nr:hypothetical protein NC653_028796 [Populus alba x Populus x berolinensis]